MGCVHGAERLYRIFSGNRCGLFLPSGNKAAGGTDRLFTGGILSLLELCGEKGLFRNRHFYKKKPLTVTYGIGIEEHDQEGRVITLEYENFYMVTVYTPNSKVSLARLEY